MSRHRDIRNINIADELDDDALSDGGEEEMTSEQQGLHETALLAFVQAEFAQAQMNDALDQVKLVIGNKAQSGLSDNAIRDVLWEYYFDVEKTVQWALEELERILAKERKKGNDNAREPSLDLQEGASFMYQHQNQSGDLCYTDGDGDQSFDDESTRPRLPSIFLAQQQPGFDNQAYLAVPPSPRINRLSTITERTERTEPSMLYRPRQQSMIPNTPRSFVSSDTTDYGKELDPNTSGASPSGSAIQRLSTYDPPPSNSSTISPDHQPYPMTASEPLSSLRTIPSIPDLNSKSSTQPFPQDPIPVPSLSNKSHSKLSKLASSRASMSTKSESSRSSGTSVTGSIKTFPALRPSAQSERPPSSVASSKELPPTPSISSSSNLQSSTSSLVRKAIQTALELEAGDKEATPIPSGLVSTVASMPSDRARTPTPTNPGPLQNVLEVKPPSTPSRPLSKLALLAQQKAEAANKYPPSLQTPASELSSSRPLSKLATLAQQKVDATRVPKLPKTTTEYLTPIANGPSVTTAITTSYQSLYSLTDPSRSNVIPKLNVVPLQSPIGTSPSDAKPSKLAMKIKRAGEKTPASPGFPSEGDIEHPISPIFRPKSTSARALPSAFASVLVDNNIIFRDKVKSKEARRRKEKRRKEVETSMDESHKTRQHPDSPFNGESLPRSTFTFDAAKEREKALKLAQNSAGSSRATTPVGAAKGAKKSSIGISTPVRRAANDQQNLDLAGLNLDDKTDQSEIAEEPPKMSLSREKVLEEAKRALENESHGAKQRISIVVIGHVDAGKSTLMGRLLDPSQTYNCLDAPGHKDFIPNMISGASEADTALLVVDAGVGEFEAGFQRNGQTREHLLLVRSLGVSQVVVAVNKLDQVEWSKSRYEEICAELKPFLAQSGFQPSKAKFVPVAAMEGVNLVDREGATAIPLSEWYNGPTLVDLLAIEIEDQPVPWAASGSNVSLSLVSIDPVNVNVGSVLCPPSDLVPLATIFTARIVVFDIQVPITAGASVELFHHSRDVPATTTKLISVIDRGSGKVLKANPRFLTKGSSAEVQITLRSNQLGGISSTARGIPLEKFSTNKDMGRILMRRGGETIAAGIVLEISG
ncbi:hypothetical protein CPB84DRAFT_1846637 [Gymnopilus junonius]|uniref:Tr-type G domain-containing protein n=1 Tax=Gymnopilus junonius TaxID=109634 RepID=A0A9P5NLN4_GYMJU|nr:hypothetical protein CPB84DRAFT_1846637 [Gymnopilus junonius]